MRKLLTLFCFTLLFIQGFSQQNSKKKLALHTIQELTPVQVVIQPTTFLGKKAVQVLDTAKGITGEKKYAKINSLSFRNGRIEVEVAGRPRPAASGTARGFIGIAFHINESDTKFECIYLRPANGRSEDQVRRNHSVQYISFPHYPWERSRKETPEKYESYVDLETGKWTKVTIEVQDSVAKLYVHGATQPTLIVSDLKHGVVGGNIGLWIGPETEGYFRNLVITPKD